MTSLALLSHQMEQRLKLEHELRLEKDRLGQIKHNIFELKEKVDQKEMLRLGPFGHRDIVSIVHKLQCL